MMLPACMDKILRLEDAIKNIAELSGEVVMPLEHYFAHGNYIRKIFIPAGTLLTSKIHKHGSTSIIMLGDVIVNNGDENPLQYSAPAIFSTEGWIKRGVYAITDVIWVTIHRTDALTLEDAEAEIVTEDLTQFLELQQ